MNKTCVLLLLLASAGIIVNSDELGTVKHIQMRTEYVSHNKLQELRPSLEGELSKLQTGIKTWSTSESFFRYTATTSWLGGCSDTDVDLFPISQGLSSVTKEEFWELVSADRINNAWGQIRTMVKNVHDVRYQVHQLTCKDLKITNTACGKEGYKQIQELIKKDKTYAQRYKQSVTDGLIISHLYEVGTLR